MDRKTFLLKIDEYCTREESCSLLYRLRKEVVLSGEGSVLSETLRPGRMVCRAALDDEISNHNCPKSLGTSYCPKVHPEMAKQWFPDYCVD